MKCVPAIALTLVILPAAPILADEARIPIFQPTTITQPGYYILTRDLSPASGTAITIQSDGVTVDLGVPRASIRIYDPTTGVEPVRTATNVSSLELALSDHPIVIAIPPTRQ